MYRYQKIESKIWHDEKFKTLSDDGKVLFLYFLTSPHSNILGIYVLPKEYIIADLKWSSKRLSKPFTELLKTELCFYENDTELLLVTNHLKHNPIENPNQAKSAEKALSDLPKSSLLQHVKLLDKPFLKPLAELLAKRYAKPEESTEEGKGTEEGKEEEENTADAFSLFWKLYPNKKEPKAALKAWEKSKGSRPPIEKILEAIQKQIEWRQNANGEFRPEWKHPATWLNKGCWDDEITTQEASDDWTKDVPEEYR